MFNRARWGAEGDLRAAAIRITLVGVWLGAFAVLAWAAVQYLTLGLIGMDAYAYWLAGRNTHPYGGTPGAFGAFLYSPLFAQAMRLVAWLPFDAFFALLAAVNTAAMWWLTKPLPWRWRVPALVLYGAELLVCNITPLLAVALVLSIRRPEALALPTLTKITPGAVGFLWHLARGDLRAVIRGALVTLALVLASFAAEPHLWLDWVDMLTGADRAATGPGAMLRLAVAMVVAVVAARLDRPRLLALAFALSLPTAGVIGIQGAIVLCAAARLPARHQTPIQVNRAVDAAA